MGANVSLAGAVGLMVGSLLPWASVGYMSITPPLTSSDAGLLFICGIIVGACALGWLSSRSDGFRWTVVVFGLVGTGLAILEMVSLTTDAPAALVSLSAGLFVCALGGIASIVGGFIR